jgi:hypothetical protein
MTTHFVLGHGQIYSKSKQTVSSVPKNKTLIIIAEMGDVLTYEAANVLVRTYFHTQEGVNTFIKRVAKEKGFKVLTQGQQFIDTVIEFYDTGVWTGATKIPEPQLREGIFGHQADMSISPQRSPPRKRISTMLSTRENEKETYIVFSCRGVKNVPGRYIYETGKRKRLSDMTLKQKTLLTLAKKEDQRKAIKRKRETPILRRSITQQPAAKKRKIV